MMKKVVISLVLIILMCLPLVAQEDQPLYVQPVFITSAGQSPGALQMSVLARAVQLTHIFERILSSADFDPEGIGTVIIVAGASGKGLGAAGIDIDAEISRIYGIVEKALEADIPVILVQLEGVSRRGPSSDRIVESIRSMISYLIVKTDADEDSFFSEISETEEIPIIFFERTNDVRDILRELFL